MKSPNTCGTCSHDGRCSYCTDNTVSNDGMACFSVYAPPFDFDSGRDEMNEI